jgi:hypothetical protein
VAEMLGRIFPYKSLGIPERHTRHGGKSSVEELIKRKVNCCVSQNEDCKHRHLEKRAIHNCE